MKKKSGPLNKPLSEAEIDELDSFLISDRAPEECMDISMLDGFITAIVSGPEMIVPSEWMAVVWGDHEGPEFESVEQAERIMDYIMRLSNNIIHTLMDSPEEYCPLLYANKEKGKEYVIAEEWCDGYLLGIEMRKEEWLPLSKDDDAFSRILPILALSSKPLDKEVEALVDTEEKLEKWTNLLPAAVVEIYRFWLERRNIKESTFVPDTQNINVYGPKVGRNEPCPCGSGKKLKKCCGSPARLN